MSNSETQPRTYGGKCGVWLKKKKKRRITMEAATSRDDTSTPKSPEHAPSDVVSISSGCSGSKDDDSGREEEHRRISEARLVGWDDVLCRPIYQSAPESGISTDENGEDIAASGSKDECEDAEDKSTYCDAEEGQLSGPVRNRAGRSYGKRKHGKMGLSAAAIETLEQNRSSPPAASKSVMHKVISEKVDITDEKYSSPDTSVTLPTSPSSGESSPPVSDHLASICCFPETSEEEDSDDSINATTTSEKMHKASKTAAKRKSVKKKSLGNKLNDQQKLALPDLGCEETKQHRQPSCYTSLESARAFFENLDSTEQLSIDTKEKETTSATRSGCIRTTRRANTNCPILKENYENYRKATALIGVSPISLSEFANNRAHFQNAQNLDGFLDVALSPKNTSRT